MLRYTQTEVGTQNRDNIKNTLLDDTCHRHNNIKMHDNDPSINRPNQNEKRYPTKSHKHVGFYDTRIEQKHKNATDAYKYYITPDVVGQKTLLTWFDCRK